MIYDDDIDWKQLAIDRSYSRFWAAFAFGLGWGVLLMLVFKSC